MQRYRWPKEGLPKFSTVSRNRLLFQTGTTRTFLTLPAQSDIPVRIESTADKTGNQENCYGPTVLRLDIFKPGFGHHLFITSATPGSDLRFTLPSWGYTFLTR